MLTILNTLSDPKLLELLKHGAVGVLPSDTIYGLVCPAGDQAAVQRLYELKSREHKPGTVIAANIEQLEELGLKARYLKAVEQFWPNPLTIIIPTGFELDYLDMGLHSLAVRIPKDTKITELLKKTGALLTSSANQPGQPVANTVAEAEAYFGDQVDFYVDGGDLAGRPPSTIIRIVDDEIEVLREGAVKIDASGRIEA